MGAPRYDIAELREAYDMTPACSTGGLFWQMVADRIGRSVDGVYNRCVRLEGWAPKVLKAKPCHMCAKRCGWEEFADGGRIRACRACTADVMEGRR